MRALPNLAATASVAALLALWPSAAQATDYCVGPTTRCTPANTFAGVQPALTAAEAPGDDRVLIATGTYDVPAGGLTYDGDKLDVLSVGTSTVVLRQTATADAETAIAFRSRGGGRSRVKGLSIVVGKSDFGPNTALRAGGATDIVGLTVRPAPDATNGVGVELRDTATLSSADVDLGSVRYGATAVVDPGAGDTTTITASALRALWGVEARSGASVRVDRSRVTAFETAIGAYGASVVVNDPIIRLEDRGLANMFAFDAIADTKPASIDVRYATVTGGDSSDIGMRVGGSPTAPARGSLLSSIVLTQGISVMRAVSPGGPGASLEADFNAFDPRARVFSDPTTPGVFSNTNSRADDPRFAGDPALGDVRLRPDSPFIDAGHPALLAPSFDFNGGTRAVDGNGDGEARADLGAVEYQGP